MSKVKQEREELAGLDAAALRQRLDEEKKKLWTSSFSHGKRTLADTSSLSKSRKTIARIHTYLRQLELKESK